MANDGRVIIKVEENARSASRNFDTLDKSIKGTTTSSKALSTAIKGAITIASLNAIKNYTISLVNLASEAEETANKFNVTFSGIRSEAEQTAQNLADNFGLANTEAQKLLSNTGDLLTGFEFTQEQALALSNQVNELAVDLASFTNIEGGAQRASQAITSALLGEREAVKSLGIAITEADIKQLAEEKGITGELTRQQKAVLTLELALKQSKNAIGDFQRSQESYANQARVTNALLTDLGVALGQEILPSFTTLRQEFNLFLQEEGANVVEGFRILIDILDVVKQGFDILVAGVQQAGGAVTTLVLALNDLKNFEGQRALDTLSSGFANVGQIGTQAVNEFRVAWRDLQNELANEDTTPSPLVTKIVNGTQQAKQSTNDLVTNTKTVTDDISNSFSSISNSIASGIVTPLQDGENAFTRFAQIAIGALQDIAQEILASGIQKQLSSLATSSTGSGLSGFLSSLVTNAHGNAFVGGKVQAFANGGVVSNPTLFPMANGTGLMGEAGAEAIMPLKRQQNGDLGVQTDGMSPTVNIYNQTDAQIEVRQRPNNDQDIFIRRVNSIVSGEQGQNAFQAGLERQQKSGFKGS